MIQTAVHFDIHRVLEAISHGYQELSVYIAGIRLYDQQLSHFFIELSQIDSQRKMQKCTRRGQEGEREMGREEMGQLVPGIASVPVKSMQVLFHHCLTTTLIFINLAHHQRTILVQLCYKRPEGDRVGSHGPSGLVSTHCAMFTKVKACKSHDYVVPSASLSSNNANIKSFVCCCFVFYYQGQDACS